MYQERISRVLAAMERMGLEQMLVSDPDSIWYLTGYDVFPFERLYAFYLRKDGQHKLFLNKLFPVPEAPYEQVWFSDTDDYLAILANAVDGEKDMGVDKDWPAAINRALRILSLEVPGWMLKPLMVTTVLAALKVSYS